MTNIQSLQVLAETPGAVPDDAVSFAVERVSSLLRVASEPVLFAWVKLTMAADPAVERPAVAQVNIDLNGRPVRSQAAGQTIREATEHACARIRLERAARNWAAICGGLPSPGPGGMAAPGHPGATPALLPPSARAASRDAAQVVRTGPPDPR